MKGAPRIYCWDVVGGIKNDTSEVRDLEIHEVVSDGVAGQG